MGCNKAGNCAPGVGIATGRINADSTPDLRPEQWTLLDQTGTQRVPQQSQHIGGIVDAAPEYEGVEYPSPAQVGSAAVRFVQGADINDTAFFVVADTAAVDGAIADTVTGAINDTGATIAIGNVLWGKVPVA